MQPQDTTTPTLEPALYLFPVTLSDAPLQHVLPEFNLGLLRQMRHLVVENVRSARRFLKLVDKSIDVNLISFTELNEHTRPEEVAAMLQPLADGSPMGILSEAGCPAIADPGADLVAVAQRRGFRVIPLIGPSSILLSLMGSGFNGQSFAFLGYLPIDTTARNRMMQRMRQRIVSERQTQIFIETPYRNNRLIAELTHSLPGDMLLCVACDITGSSESITTKTLAKWAKTSYNYDKRPAIFLLFS